MLAGECGEGAGMSPSALMEERPLTSLQERFLRLGFKLTFPISTRDEVILTLITLLTNNIAMVSGCQYPSRSPRTLPDGYTLTVGAPGCSLLLKSR